MAPSFPRGSIRGENKMVKKNWRKAKFTRKTIDESMDKGFRYCKRYFRGKKEKKACEEGIAEIAAQIVKKPIK